MKCIPLATQTFSKSATNVVKGASPLFFDRGKGCRVWDPDGNEYIDYVLGLLPVVLGYCDPDVDAAIRKQLDRGITFSLACDLEVELAERLIDIIPCAERVRFGKNGSDATTAAIRLARAHTGRDRIALCGYHGWHDWYIGTTTRDLGVPESVRELSQKFAFNDLEAVEGALRANPDGFAAVILEPAGTVDPAAGFLEGLRDLTARYGTLLIFDEIVTGFRLHMGGAQAAFGVEPDLACFGKAMGNGMPISAVVGHAEIMDLMEDIFFSSTFGGEALSLAASIATIDKLIASDGVRRIHALGARMSEAVGKILESHGLQERYSVRGPDWRPVISVTPADVTPALATSLLRQELVAAGIFMGSAFNICLAHDEPGIFDETLQRWEIAAQSVADIYRSNDPAARLRGRLIEPVFKVRDE